LVYPNQDIFDAVQGSAFIQVRLTFTKDSDKTDVLNRASPSEEKYMYKYGYMPLNRSQYLEGKYWDENRGLARAIIAGNLDRPELEKLDQRLGGYPPVESGVRIGYWKLWIFSPARKGN
jgi:hypothetical protein